jgi:hypothetical protein
MARVAASLVIVAFGVTGLLHQAAPAAGAAPRADARAERTSHDQAGGELPECRYDDILTPRRVLRSARPGPRHASWHRRPRPNPPRRHRRPAPACRRRQGCRSAARRPERVSRLQAPEEAVPVSRRANGVRGCRPRQRAAGSLGTPARNDHRLPQRGRAGAVEARRLGQDASRPLDAQERVAVRVRDELSACPQPAHDVRGTTTTWAAMQHAPSPSHSSRHASGSGARDMEWPDARARRCRKSRRTGTYGHCTRPRITATIGGVGVRRPN